MNTTKESRQDILSILSDEIWPDIPIKNLILDVEELESENKKLKEALDFINQYTIIADVWSIEDMQKRILLIHNTSSVALNQIMEEKK